MPSAFDILDAGQPAVDDVPVLDTPTQFGRGLRSGYAGAQSQLHALAGTAGEAVGAGEFARGQYADAAARQQDAEAMAPRVSSYKDVHGIRDAFDYVSGLAGQSVPQSGAVVAGGIVGGLVGGTPGALAGATLAGTPFEAGDIAQRQQADPAAAGEDASLRLGKALAGGAASSAVQSILPEMAASKIVGTAARKGLREALHDGVTHLPGAMALEGGTEAGGEAIKQVVTNPDAPLNTDALLEAGIGGAAAGVPLHAAGVAGDVAHAGVAAPGNVLARGADAVKGALGKTDDAAPVAADPVDNLRGIYDAGKAKAKDFWQAAADGTDAAAAWAKGKGLTPEQIKEKLPEADAERVGTITDWAKEQLAKGALTPERAAFLQDKLATITEPASQQAVAMFKRGMDAASEVGAKAKDLLDTFMEGRKAPTAKQSADFGGVDATIAQHVMPVLQEMHPGLENDPATMNRVAEGVRMAMHVFAEGGREAASSTRVAKLIDIFGDKTAEVLDRVQGALQSVPASKRENFYSALNEIKRQQKDSDKVLGLMQRSLAPELQDTVKMPELHRELKVLREWVANTDAPTEETAFKGDQVLRDMQTRYGDKAEAILKALEAEHEKTAKVDNVVNEEDAKANGLQGVDANELGDSIEYGREVKPSAEAVAKAKAAGEEVPKAFRTLDLHPDLDPNGDKGQATQALVKATTENPSRTARFVSAKELGDAHPGVQHTLKRLASDFMEAGKTPEQAQALAKKSLEHYGMVVADGKSQPGTIDRSNVKSVMVGKGAKDVPRSHYDQPSVFKADGKAFDARALTKEMQKQFAGQDDVTDKSAIHRNARMFMEGIAALQDHLGTKIDLPDTLVIDGKGTTVADAKKLGFTPDRRTDEVAEKRVQALKDRYAKMAEGVTNPEEVHALRTELADKIAEERDRAMNFDPREDLTTDATERDADPFNDSTVTLGNKTEPVNRNADGSARLVPNTSEADKAAAADRMKPADKAALDKLMSALASKAETAAGHAIVARGQELLANADVINRSGQRALTSMLQRGKKLSDIASTINALHEKYQSQFKPAGKEADAQVTAKKAPAAAPAAAPKGQFDVDRMVIKDEYGAVTDDAKADAFLKEAAERLRDLKAIGDERTDAQDEAYYHLRDFFAHTNDLGSFYDQKVGADGSKDLEVRKALAKAAPEVAAIVDPKGGSKRSAEAIDPNASVSPAQRAQMRAYINDVLGPQVKAALARILHAGEYVEAIDTIRVSVHALNPMAVAYHESLHAFMAKLLQQGNGRVAQVLRDVAMSANVQEQLRDTFANQPSVLRQLADPEEAAAYMYQLWKQGQLTVGPAAKGVLGRISDMIRKTLGIWSKNERAEEIMRYFSSGEFKRNAGRPNEVTRALIESGKNPAIERARELARPLTDFAETVGSAGSERLRSTGIPALVEMSKLMKATGREARDDKGFIPTAREVRARTMNAFAAAMKNARDEHVADAMKALQTRSGAATPEGRLIVRQVKTLLQQQLRYMQQAGVETTGILPDPDYFPRKYDAAYISRHRDAFTAILENHGIDTATAAGITQRLMGNNGADPLFEINRPGMVNLKQRKLGDIPDAILEPFMSKNLWEVMDSYVSQASRRAEWARRFGDRADSMDTFLQAARAQGATDKQIKLADNFIKAVDGTLGDDLNPEARRMMGNALVYENVRLLPLAIFSSVIDPLGIVVRGGTVGDAWTTFKRGVGDLPRAWKKTYTTDGAEQMAETLGVIDSAILGHDTSSLYMQGMASDTAKKINDSFFRWNFMDGFNRSMRVGATQAAIKFLERNADGRASAHSVRWLSELGLTPADLAGGVDPYAPKVRAAINQWVDGAILRPDAADKPVWMNDPHFMLISHLKQFAYAFQETILKRVAHEARAGNYAPAWALASYVPVMVASDMVKGILQGGGDVPQWKRGWGPGDYIESGVERAGLFGAGQFAVDAAKDVSRGDLFPGSLTGPAIDQLKEAILTVTGREKPVTFAEHSLPAHSLYMGFVDKANTHADPTFAE